MKQEMCDRDRRLTVLLRDFGYGFRGGMLFAVGPFAYLCPNFTRRTFRSVFDAAEYLCPIVSDKEYTSRFVAITKVTP